MTRQVLTPIFAVALSLTLPLPLATAQAQAQAPAQGTPAAAAAAEHTFAAEADAIKACGNDPVVWINKKHSVYHLKTSRWYGKTKGGAYACQSEMDKAGHHQAKDERSGTPAPAPDTAAPPK
jgi:hypothetical protein